MINNKELTGKYRPNFVWDDHNVDIDDDGDNRLKVRLKFILSQRLMTHLIEGENKIIKDINVTPTSCNLRLMSISLIYCQKNLCHSTTTRQQNNHIKIWLVDFHSKIHISECHLMEFAKLLINVGRWAGFGRHCCVVKLKHFKGAADLFYCYFYVF